MRQSKCVVCGNYFDTDQMVVISAKKYCPTCSKPRLAEAKWHKRLMGYLDELLDDRGEYLPRFAREIKNLQEQKSINSKAVYLTLKYVFSLDRPPVFEPDKGITWIVDIYYPQAKKYYNEIKELQAKYSDDVIKQVLNKPVKSVQVNRSDLIQKESEFIERKKTILYGPEIDLDEI